MSFVCSGKNLFLLSFCLALLTKDEIVRRVDVEVDIAPASQVEQQGALGICGGLFIAEAPSRGAVWTVAQRGRGDAVGYALNIPGPQVLVLGNWFAS